MDSTNVDYKEGQHSDFIEYLFSSEPKEKGSIQLELPLDSTSKNKYHHIFEQLLMIFVDGLKYFYGNSEGKVNIQELQKKDIDLISTYFESFNFKVHVSIFPTIHEYEFKYPNYLKEPDKIKDTTQLMDFFYEIFCDHNIVYRIQFNYLN